MDTLIKPEKYRKLSVTALVTGILAIFIIGIYIIIFIIIGDLTNNYIFEKYIMPSVSGIIIGLTVAAVICGGIDLNKIQKGLWSKKGRGFDITGITIGGLFILIISSMILSDVLIPG